MRRLLLCHLLMHDNVCNSQLKSSTSCVRPIRHETDEIQGSVSGCMLRYLRDFMVLLGILVWQWFPGGMQFWSAVGCKRGSGLQASGLMQA